MARCPACYYCLADVSAMSAQSNSEVGRVHVYLTGDTAHPVAHHGLHQLLKTVKRQSGLCEQAVCRELYYLFILKNNGRVQRALARNRGEKLTFEI